MNHSTRLQWFPVSFFSMVMGLTGLAIAWQKAENALNWQVHPSTALLGLAVLSFVTLLLFYGAKLVRHPSAVSQEFNHPVKLSFFPTITISLLLLSVALLPLNRSLSFWLWVVGASSHLLFTIRIISIWIQRNNLEIAQLNPAWFIPVVGNIIVPLAGIEHAPPEISWFFFSIGLVFWIVLFAIMLYRLIFQPALPGKLVPTLFILIAPPPAGFLSLLKLHGTGSEAGTILYWLALFLFIPLAAQLKLFLKLKFFLSWWAYTFPLAALTIASFAMGRETGLAAFTVGALVLCGLLSLLAAGILIRTIVAATRREICVEE